MAKAADYIAKGCDLHAYIERGDTTPEGVERRWRQAFSCAARRMGFARKQRSFLWDELARGNWERLHMTEEEQRKTAGEWLDELSWEVFYCCDRWCLDRLMRCHWLYRNYKEVIGDDR